MLMPQRERDLLEDGCEQPNYPMKSLIQSIAILALLLVLTNCTAYVDPNGLAPSATTTTTTRTISDPYSPDASVTTEKTTTRY